MVALISVISGHILLTVLGLISLTAGSICQALYLMPGGENHPLFFFISYFPYLLFLP